MTLGSQALAVPCSSSVPAKEHIKAHIEVAKRQGATKEEVLELLELLVLPCGVPKFMLGYEAWAESFSVRRVEVDAP